MARCGLLALVLIGCGGGEKDLTVSGRIEADRVRIGSKIGGRIEKVNVEEGDDVKAGDVVIELESAELEAQLAQARALAAQAQAEVDLLLAGARAEDVRRAEGQVKARQAELQLREKGFRSEEVGEAEAQLASAKSDLELARKEYERAKRLLESATIDREEFDRKRMVLETQQAAAVLIRKGDNWVRCYVPENRLGLVRPGKEVLITVDSYPGEVFPGIVRWVSAEAEFTPRNVQTSEKRAELAFEMKVDIKEKDGKLRPGMYADVHIREEAGP
ncbi:MAG TPA: efflux RND transporter periplasmic adaptor subunit [Sumerlaeia bacterium]|nr:efflux RND transporter periplasmic adaptor subunit [Sumerlaeia bacterium]